MGDFVRDREALADPGMGGVVPDRSLISLHDEHPGYLVAERSCLKGQAQTLGHEMNRDGNSVTVSPAKRLFSCFFEIWPGHALSSRYSAQQFSLGAFWSQTRSGL